MSHPVYIFDVDGVITDPETRQSDFRVLTAIADLLEDGAYVAFNTGRGYPWTKSDVVDKIKSQISAEALNRMFVVVEMGGIAVSFNGSTERDYRSDFGLSIDDIALVRRIYDEYKDNKNIAWYDDKLSMATMYRPTGADQSVFNDLAVAIKDDLLACFPPEAVRISTNPDAIDVTTPQAGKAAGSKLIAEWLASTAAADTREYLCFGDNASDYEMATYFARLGHVVTFVFTGSDESRIAHDAAVGYVKTQKPFNEGTLAHLQLLH